MEGLNYPCHKYETENGYVESNKKEIKRERAKREMTKRGLNKISEMKTGMTWNKSYMDLNILYKEKNLWCCGNLIFEKQRKILCLCN